MITVPCGEVSETSAYYNRKNSDVNPQKREFADFKEISRNNPAGFPGIFRKYLPAPFTIRVFDGILINGPGEGSKKFPGKSAQLIYFTNFARSQEFGLNPDFSRFRKGFSGEKASFLARPAKIGNGRFCLA
ncbi:MAG: hypothetical protein II739_08980, partial [Clostridia bacterium]|nr:hypothetical protein [Clostridia bacterium]